MRIALILIGSLLAASPVLGAADAEAPSGEPAPAIQGQGLDGTELSLADWDGRVVLVNFWASWCVPCRKELPAFAELYRELEPRGLTILAVGVDRVEGKARRFLRKSPVPFPVLLDPTQEIVARYGPTTMPTSFLLDRDGVIRHVQHGFRESELPELRSRIEELLVGPVEEQAP